MNKCSKKYNKFLKIMNESYKERKKKKAEERKKK